MSIYSTNILSVGLSVWLQKAKELRFLWMFSSLFLKFNYIEGFQLVYLVIEMYVGFPSEVLENETTDAKIQVEIKVFFALFY